MMGVHLPKLTNSVHICRMVGQKKYRWLKDDNERLQGKHGYGSCSIRMQMEKHYQRIAPALILVLA
jgi:hypothetical protein